jgi:hypothetical protein
VPAARSALAARLPPAAALRAAGFPVHCEINLPYDVAVRNVPCFAALGLHKEQPMSTQADALWRDTAHDAGTDPTVFNAPSSQTPSQSAGRVAGDAAARVSDTAQAAGRQAREVASGLAGEVNQNVKGLLNDQLAVGADLAGHLAAATRVAADNLVPKAPQLAGMVRTAADTIDDFAGTMRDRSVEDLVQTASQFTRRQPAAVFGAAALAGFFLFRVLKAGGDAGGDHDPSIGGRHGA